MNQKAATRQRYEEPTSHFTNRTENMGCQSMEQDTEEDIQNDFHNFLFISLSISFEPTFTNILK